MYQDMLQKAKDGVFMLQFPVHDVWAIFSHNTGSAYLNNQCLSAFHLNSSVPLTNCMLIKHGSVAPNTFTMELTSQSSIIPVSGWRTGKSNKALKQGFIKPNSSLVSQLSEIVNFRIV